MKRFTMLLGLAVLLLTPVVLADVPKLINFQGILRDGSGNPVTDGVYVIRFRIYDDSTAGSNLWEEFNDVQTTNGLFNVRLGDTTDLPNGLFEGSVNRFVAVKVGGDPESAPRTRLISVPFAFHALKSDSAATATVALDLTCSGCVGTGDIDATQVQRRVTGVAPVGNYIRAVNQDGSIVTGVDANDTYTAGTGLNLAGNQFSIAPDGVTASQIAAGSVGTSEIDATQVQRRVTGVAPVGNYIRAVNQDGSVVISADQTGGWTDAGTVVRLTNSTASVGIGTAAPTSNLHILENADATVGLVIENTNTGGSSAERISFNNEDGSVAGISIVDDGAITDPSSMSIFNNRPGGSIQFNTAGLDRVTLSNGGDFGIGTESPDTRLHVAGGTDASLANGSGYLVLGSCDLDQRGFR